MSLQPASSQPRRISDRSIYSSLKRLLVEEDGGELQVLREDISRLLAEACRLSSHDVVLSLQRLDRLGYIHLRRGRIRVNR